MAKRGAAGPYIVGFAVGVIVCVITDEARSFGLRLVVPAASRKDVPATGRRKNAGRCRLAVARTVSLHEPARHGDACAFTSVKTCRLNGTWRGSRLWRSHSASRSSPRVFLLGYDSGCLSGGSAFSYLEPQSRAFT